jgi:acyl-CoA reductase-like NAD-dependent aldehyde dehydrogenase
MISESRFSMTINGAAVSGPPFAVINPATGEAFADAPSCSPEQLDMAFGAADAAFQQWQADENGRRDTLLAAADLVDHHAGELSLLLTTEQGKPLREARYEVRGVGRTFRYFADLADEPEVIQDDERARVEVRRRAVGVVGAITPWNFPLSLAAWKLAPAWRAGNTVVLKPSPHTPLTTLRLGEILSEAFPPGVLNVVSGPDPLGSLMTNHSVPRKISFTGSVGTGRAVATSAASDLKRVTLELGGNDPAIILEDVDPAAVADRIFWAAFANNGQICSAIKRVYVPATLHDALVDALAEKARTVQVGDGTDPTTELGPINNEPQLKRVRDLVEDAAAQGARVAAGGHAAGGKGYFFDPTVIGHAEDGTRLVDEEQFGPVLPLIPYGDVNEAVQRANGTHFGLSASVWSDDLDRAQAIASQVDCGTTWINTHLVIGPDQPFGGTKWSGIGVENGRWAVEGCTQPHVLYLAKA